VLWNLRTAAGCWKVAAGFMKAGDELLVPLDCPLCEGEKWWTARCARAPRRSLTIRSGVPCPARPAAEPAR
jgi:hypothetical protein